MTEHLFKDLFTKFELFFKGQQVKNSRFLYDVSFGFLPRFFDPHNQPDDRIIYDEEAEVPEFYFGLSGKVGVGYTVNGRGLEGKQYRLCKFFVNEFLICDYFVLNKKRSEFLYMTIKPVKCFALQKKFLHKTIFPRYPEIEQ